MPPTVSTSPRSGRISGDVLRALIAAAPTAVSILHIADILGVLHGTDRLHEVAPVQRAVTALLANGVVPARPDAIELTLANGVVLALPQLDTDPYRADVVRAHTIHALAQARVTGRGHDPLAAHTYRTVLVRFWTQVQAVLPPARPGQPGLTGAPKHGCTREPSEIRPGGTDRKRKGHCVR